jgi:hypothetical protein
MRLFLSILFLYISGTNGKGGGRGGGKGGKGGGTSDNRGDVRVGKPTSKFYSSNMNFPG